MPRADIVFPEPVISARPWLGAFLAAVILLAIAVGVAIVVDIRASREHRNRLAVDTERTRDLSGLHAGYQPKHRRRLPPPGPQAARVPAADVTQEIRRVDGSWRA